jgi:ketosteroid isomerase-like protein
MSEQDNVALVERGFAAFNQADLGTLSEIIADDAVQHMQGNNPFTGDHKGRDNILGMYGQIGEASNGTFQAVLKDTKPSGDKVVATYAGQAERDGKTLASTNTITFTIRDGKIVDIADVPSDLAEWDAFWG